MDKQWYYVREFQLKFGHPVAESPTLIEKKRVQKRYNWMLEEINEFLQAEDIVEQADAMIDVIYFALGTLVEMGIKPDNLFDIVQDANMAKLWSDGKPHYNNEGKIIKPSTWKEPYDKLKAEIDHQAKDIN